MKSICSLFVPALLAVLSPIALSAAEPNSQSTAPNCGCDCCKGKDVCCCSAEPAAAGTAKRYPLKGVIVDILAGKSALLVRHAEIPGFMRAMTMLFKVDATTLQLAVKGQAITGTLVKRDDGFWLEDVKPATAPAS